MYAPAARKDLFLVFDLRLQARLTKGACALASPFCGFPLILGLHMQVGLKDGSFVFASFNQPFKINPTLFAVWMRILLQVPGSQLWILKLNEVRNTPDNW